MITFALAFPVIDPVAFTVGGHGVRWYGLAYSAGILFGWLMARWMVDKAWIWQPIPISGTAQDVDACALLAIIGILAGGRLGYLAFYDTGLLTFAPGDAVRPWLGGMSFHGGAAGSAILVAFYVWRKKLPVLSGLDLLAVVAPVGLFFGRIANFINGEAWGRVSDVPWAMVFPAAGPELRHPSQLYEAGAEGILFGLVMLIIAMRGGLGRAGLAGGFFCFGYGVLRIFCEFFREPDGLVAIPGLGITLSTGQALCIPMLAIGLFVMGLALRKPPVSPHAAA